MGRLSVTHALALRRLAVAGGALGASLVAHCAAAGDLRLTATAPFAWVGLLAMTTVVGARRASARAASRAASPRWSPPRP